MDDKVVVGKESFSADSSRGLQPMGTLQFSPAATVLNYGQALFEGMKAFRRHDGTIALFRPEMNAWRMQQGAERFLLPAVPTDVFVLAAEHTVRANAQWVPPFGRGAFYLSTFVFVCWIISDSQRQRLAHNILFWITGPLLMGFGAGLGVKPSDEATFCIF